MLQPSRALDFYRQLGCRERRIHSGDADAYGLEVESENPREDNGDRSVFTRCSVSSLSCWTA